jgi:apolipoprotein N-acyltransferase
VALDVASTAETPVAGPARTSRSSLSLSILFGLVSAVLLDFCFPVGGPMPWWRGFLTWIALVPLLYALLHESSAGHPHYLRRAALTGYLCGVLWYILNCYWIYQTMLYYGHVPAPGAAGILVLFSLVLGLYFGLFGLGLAFFRRRFGLNGALILAPFLWTALELAAARITSVPWDQLGYSQVDSSWVTGLAPVTGVYGISFILVAGNVYWFWTIRQRKGASLRRSAWGIAFLVALIFLMSGGSPAIAPAASSDYAVLLQPNIDVEPPDNWKGTEWQGNTSWLTDAARQTCTAAYEGMPVADTPPPAETCAGNMPPPGMVLWPEVGSWMRSDDPRTLALLRSVATSAKAPFIAGMVGEDPAGIYNSAIFVDANGAVAGRYDKIHLVPFGEYVPYRNLFFFANHLTRQVGDFTRGRNRSVFRTGGHTFGVFICYESVFADEVRLFAQNGADVLVNISDDGWYGDTSAPWQHLNMARMRAIENDRWILRDTNNGVTTVIDPKGRVTLSAPRHTLTSLVARYGYRSDLTFYTRYGDIFAYFCCVVCGLAVIFGVWSRRHSDERAPSSTSAV